MSFRFRFDNDDEWAFFSHDIFGDSRSIFGRSCGAFALKLDDVVGPVFSDSAGGFDRAEFRAFTRALFEGVGGSRCV